MKVSRLSLIFGSACLAAVLYIPAYSAYDFDGSGVEIGFNTDRNADSPVVDSNWYYYSGGTPVSVSLLWNTGTLTVPSWSLPATNSGFLLQNDPDHSSPRDTDWAAGTTSVSDGMYWGTSFTNTAKSALGDINISLSALTFNKQTVNAEYAIADSGIMYSSVAWNKLSDLSFATLASSEVSLNTVLSGTTLGVDQTLWVRWYNPNGSALVDDVVISATAIPEPSTYALFLGVATLGLVGWRRFRRK